MNICSELSGLKADTAGHSYIKSLQSPWWCQDKPLTLLILLGLRDQIHTDYEVILNFFMGAFSTGILYLLSPYFIKILNVRGRNVYMTKEVQD